MLQIIYNQGGKGYMGAKEAIEAGKTTIGIEFGSTNIKAVLIGEDFKVLASGKHGWENRLENGIWTYSLDDIWNGVQDCYAGLRKDVQDRYGVSLTTTGAIGISAMMHGYMVFNDKDELMVPFRTWRNTITGEAADKLTELLDFNIPQRWSIAHLYQSILNKEEHVKDIKTLLTLAEYIHWQLTGEKVAGVGEASGMFPIDSSINDYDQARLDKFDETIAEYGFSWKIRDIMPKVLVAGDKAGTLTAEGAKKLDPSGELKAGIPLCPPEGDAGTGMTATNSVAVRTGNVSAGTSCFAMIVLEKPLSKVYKELDMVTTPSGKPVAMAHVNNCTSDLNYWVNIFKEVLQLSGAKEPDDLYTALFNKALTEDPDCAGVLSYNYFSGEPVTGMEEGRPLLVRTPDAKFDLANLMRSILYSAMGALKIGMDILIRQENVEVDKITGHGGWFNSGESAAKVMAAALNIPVSTMATAGEGGPWGQAIHAAFMISKADGETLDDFLSNKVFANSETVTTAPDAADVEGFDKWLAMYKAGLPVERAAIDNIK